MNEYCLEFSQYSEDQKMYPWHIGELDKALSGNAQDFLHNNRGQNKWQIVFIGTYEACHIECERLIRTRGTL